MSFVLGLAHFCVAHLCFLAALLPLAVKEARSRARMWPSWCSWAWPSFALLVWFWPHLGRDNLTIPVTVYILC